MRFSVVFLSLALSLFLFGQEPYFEEAFPQTRTEVITHPNGVAVHFAYDELDNLTTVQSSDGTIHYILEYDFEGGVFVIDRVNQQTVYRRTDCQDQILQEIFPNGQEIHISYQGIHLTGITLSSYGEILYEYSGDALSKVKRLSPLGEVVYEHAYEWNEPKQQITQTLIKGLGEIHHFYDPDAKQIAITTPFGEQLYQYDANQNVIYRKRNQTFDQFQYDHANQILLDTIYDGQGNPIDAHINEKDEVISYQGIQCTYDANGNLVQKITPKGVFRLVYDAFNRLSKAFTDECEVHFTYDLFGRRLSKKVIKKEVVEEETYLYFGSNEIAVCDQSGNLKHLRVPGVFFHPSIVQAVAIESYGEVFAPIYDPVCNLLQLINSSTKEVMSFETLHPFGDNIQSFTSSIPWIYSSKHYDKELDLVYFGYRYYDPSLRRWTTKDLEETEENPYLYNLNNPLKYLDPDGRFVVVVPVVIWGASAGGAIVKVVAATAAAVAGYKARKVYKKWKNEHKEPPYNGKDLGNDPNKSPGDGFEWRGGAQGQWHHKKKKHSLRPDFNHPGNVKPHWDYKGPKGEEYRLNLDGTWEPK